MEHVLKSVANFYKEMNDAPRLHNKPTLLTDERSILKANLLLEEVREYKQACEEGNLVEVADALTDILYILAGTVLEHGMGDLFIHMFNEVHRSNMTKSCKEEELAPTIMKYEKEGIGVISEKNSAGKHIVKRLMDGKILKNANYSKASLKPLLDLTEDDLLALEADKCEINFDAERMNWKPINKYKEKHDNVTSIERHSFAMEVRDKNKSVISVVLRNITVLLKENSPVSFTTESILMEGYHLLEVEDINKEKKSYYTIEKL